MRFCRRHHPKPRAFSCTPGRRSHPFIYEGGAPSEDLAAATRETTHLVMSISPDAAGDPLLQAFAGGLRAAMPKLEWAGYLSTVGVYGDHGGEWVDEDTPC